MKKRKWVLGVCLLSFLTAIGIFIAMISMEKRVLADYEKQEVWVVKNNIPKGETFDMQTQEQYLEKCLVDKKSVSTDAIMDLQELENKKSRIEIATGTILSNGMLIDKKAYEDRLNNPVLIGIKAEDLSQVVGGIIRTGDRITIYSWNEMEQKVEKKWDNLLVADCFDMSGNRIAESDEVKCVSRFNVYLSKEEVELFYEGISSKKMWIALCCE